MRLWTLGTSSAVPTHDRTLPANLIEHEGERIMFDCGEGAQRSLMTHGAGLMNIDKIFITHWHADHYSGLLGLIQTLEMEGRDKPLYIYGPPRTEEFTSRILETGYFHRNYDIIVEDLTEGDVIVGEDYEVIPFEVEHSVNAFGFVFREDSKRKANKKKMEELGLKSSPKIGELKEGNSVEIDGRKVEPREVVDEVPGRKIVYTGDTAKCDNLIEYAEEADVLLHEATCLHEIIEDRKGHSSAKQAGQVAKEANVEKLVLTHISRKYQGRIHEIKEEARGEFENTVVAEDGDTFKIKPHRPE